MELDEDRDGPAFHLALGTISGVGQVQSCDGKRNGPLLFLNAPLVTFITEEVASGEVTVLGSFEPHRPGFGWMLAVLAGVVVVALALMFLRDNRTYRTDALARSFHDLLSQSVPSTVHLL